MHDLVRATMMEDAPSTMHANIEREGTLEPRQTKLRPTNYLHAYTRTDSEPHSCQLSLYVYVSHLMEIKNDAYVKKIRTLCCLFEKTLLSESSSIA